MPRFLRPSLTRSGKQLVMILQLESPSRDLVILTFQLAGDLEIDTATLPIRGDSRIVAWLYEEWDLDRRGQCWFDVLLGNGWTVKLPFRAFSYSIGKQLLPSGNGDITRTRTVVGSAG